MAVVELANVTKRFGSKIVLNRVSLRVEKGSLHLVVGPNGAGKTTLLRIVLGILIPDEGVVKVFGNPPRYRKDNSDIGYSGEKLGLLMEFTVEQELMFSCISKGFDVDICRDEVEKVMELFDLLELRDERIGKLSLGTRQRVSIARAFIGNPKLVVLDEPFRSLDREWRSRLAKLLKSYVAKGGTALITSHILQELEEYNARASLLIDGKIVAEGMLTEVMNA